VFRLRWTSALARKRRRFQAIEQRLDEAWRLNPSGFPVEFKLPELLRLPDGFAGVFTDGLNTRMMTGALGPPPWLRRTDSSGTKSKLSLQTGVSCDIKGAHS